MERINLLNLSQALVAWKNLSSQTDQPRDKKTGLLWLTIHDDTINKECEKLPSGSGLDNGIHFNRELSSANKLVFNFSFHHMDEYGGYSGWTDHRMIIQPSFDTIGYSIKITGRDKNGIKDYLYTMLYDMFETNNVITF
jgi:hypothetical protein